MASFVKSREAIETKWEENKNVVLDDGKLLFAFWETKMEILEKLIPPPLKPPEVPLAIAFIADWVKNGAGVVYKESALYTRASYEGEMGTYYLGMQVTDDRALFDGREYQGFPKKIGNIRFNKNGDTVEADTGRLGTTNLKLKATLGREPNESDALEMVQKTGFLTGGNDPLITFLYKHTLNPERTGLDGNPRLIRQPTVFAPKEMTLGKIEIELGSSVHDPWAELEVVRPLGAAYLVADVNMMPAKDLCEVDAYNFLPYAFNKWDWYSSA